MGLRVVYKADQQVYGQPVAAGARAGHGHEVGAGCYPLRDLKVAPCAAVFGLGKHPSVRGGEGALGVGEAGGLDHKQTGLEDSEGKVVPVVTGVDLSRRTAAHGHAGGRGPACCHAGRWGAIPPPAPPAAARDSSVVVFQRDGDAGRGHVCRSPPVLPTEWVMVVVRPGLTSVSFTPLTVTVWAVS